MFRTNFLLLTFTILCPNVQVKSLETEEIIGGEVKTIKEHPYTAYVVIIDICTCTGAFIGDRHVISAVHCLFDPREEKLTGNSVEVMGGISNSMKYYDFQFTAKAKKAYIPKRYHHISNGDATEGDIVVFLLDRPIPLFSSRVKTIALPEPYPSDKSHLYVGDRAYLTGFGVNKVISHNAPGSLKDIHATTDGKLRMAVADVISPDECKQLYNMTVLDEQKLMCARMEQHKKDEPEGSCDGDSGGPLAMELNGTKILIGILSQSPLECNEQFLPSVYTRVVYYWESINHILNGYYDPNTMMTLEYESNPRCRRITV